MPKRQNPIQKLFKRMVRNSTRKPEEFSRELQGAPQRKSRVWLKLRRNKSAVTGMIIIACFMIMILFGEQLAPHDPLETDYLNILASPSSENLLGTDYMGRDLFSRLLAGARFSLTVGLISIAIGLTVGMTLGIIAGLNKKADNIIMRFIDILMAFPGLLLSITIVATLGAGLQNVMIAIGISTVPLYARLVRGEVLKVKENDFILAARGLGATNFRLVIHHVLINISAPIIVYSTFRIASAVLAASSLSFLGLGAQPPDPEWGRLINEGRQYMLLAPWLVLAPGFFITLAILGINLFGDGLRDALDPRVGD